MNVVSLMKILMIFVGISGCFSVLFGAWLAHGGQSLAIALQDRLATALQYQFIHTLVLLLTLIMYKLYSKTLLLCAATFFFLGIVLFSGGLYIKTFFDMNIIGKFAPLGGLSFAFAWLLLGFAGSKMFQHKLGN